MFFFKTWAFLTTTFLSQQERAQLQRTGFFNKKCVFFLQQNMFFLSQNRSFSPEQFQFLSEPEPGLFQQQPVIS